MKICDYCVLCFLMTRNFCVSLHVQTCKNHVQLRICHIFSAFVLISYIFSTKCYAAISRIEYLMTCSRCLERERSQGTVRWTHLCVRAVLDGVTRITLLPRKDPRDPFLPPRRGAGPGSARYWMFGLAIIWMGFRALCGRCFHIETPACKASRGGICLQLSGFTTGCRRRGRPRRCL